MNHFVLVFETNSIGRCPKTALLLPRKSLTILSVPRFSVCLPKILASAEIFYTDVEGKKVKKLLLLSASFSFRILRRDLLGENRRILFCKQLSRELSISN